MSLIRSMTGESAERSLMGGVESEYGLAMSGLENEPIISQLSARIDRSWQENSRAKEHMELELLQCLRDRKGVYSPSEYADIQDQGSSDIFMKLPQVKIRAAAAHINSVLLPADDMAFGIEPTPIQDLPGFMQEAVFQRIMQNQQRVDQQGQPVDVVEQTEQLEQMLKEEMERQGKLACERMEKKIEDQLLEGDYIKCMTAFIDDFSTFPAAIMKGPVWEMRPSKKWERTPQGWQLRRGVELKMVFKTISVFDAYPSPNAETPQDGDFIERIRMTRGELHSMMQAPGYSKAAIQDVLIEYGRNGLTNWLWTDSQRANLENKDYHWMRHTSNEIDALHWRGRAQGRELLEWGLSRQEITDPLADYEVDAIKIGRHVIRAEVNNDPEFRRPIWRACYEQVPGSFWGNAVPYLMRDITRMCNGTARQLQNNMAHAAGMQVDINYDRLSPETDPFDIHPNKLWQFASSEFGANDRGVTFFQPTSNVNELMTVYNEFAPQADDATGIPRFAHGNENVGGAGDTARGLSLLMDSSAKLLRKSITNIDNDVIKPMVTMIYDHNMQNDPDESIRGDGSVAAKGASELLQREVARDAQIQLLELTGNDIDMAIIGEDGRAKMLRNLVNTYPSIDRSVVPTVEQLARRKQSEPPPPPPPEILKIEADKEAARAKLEQDKFIEELKLGSQEQIEKLKMNMEHEREVLKGDVALERERIVQKAKADALKEEIRDRAKGRLDELNVQREIAPLSEEPMGEEEIKKVVLSVIEPMIKKVEDLSDSQVQVVADMVDKLVDQLKPKEGAAGTDPQVINVNVDASCTKDPKKSVTFKRDKDGKMTEAVLSDGGASK